MSYTRSNTVSIPVELSGSFSYPASQTGGSRTVTLSGYVPVLTNVTVDTNNFDTSVYNASDSVNILTDSVVAMNAAQCAAIEEHSGRISKSLVSGFYNMIKSDISMKQSENNSEMQSKIALLLELSKDVLEKHSRMEQDVERLRGHYSAIFDGLDKDLKKRLMELDRPVFQLGQKTRSGIVKDPAVSSGAATADALNGNSQIEGRLFMARMKKNISSALRIMSNSVKNTLSYKNKMQDILWKGDSDQVQTEYIPIVYYVIAGDTGETDYYAAPPIADTDQVLTNVASYVRSAPGERWQAMNPEESSYIDQAFTNLVEQNSQADKSGNSSRVYSEIMRLWNNSKSQMFQLH